MFVSFVRLCVRWDVSGWMATCGEANGGAMLKMLHLELHETVLLHYAPLSGTQMFCPIIEVSKAWL